MSLAHVLLTSLIEKPSTGIELARRFDRSMGFFWNATHQQIYRELNSMLSKGWISTLAEEDAQGRKKTYQVEAAGRVELADWMVKQSPPAQLREELMVRLRAEAQLGGNEVLPELERHLQLHQEKLQLYQAIYAKDFAQQTDENRTLYIHKMILQLGIEQEIGWIRWLEAVIPALKAFDQQQ
ncbi:MULTISPECIES: PadR family transcriptional regulator [Acinetobacter]|uniref:PadR family transcriptional regulator n=1 Tax=Acinetobacter indicus TaxID=756892 RepID=A0A6C0YT82_9GAMM|nr:MULTISPECIES: PadR family transcriptional regulator [Acinetobacter]MCO8109124.1 PadR family transcriptional regulator [Acinetobacter indicus]MDM1273314.1 PadR family transcriptional regulator [Acinetobacter indicus]MDM1278778.1 PadR family transcriptional regulator [Acinetobacter indicus]MDM1281582.1 PadR family transcriptional regulator [Acinetobacter indicus]MDM1771483.1 PadR family transcriptional regulator [Acinetobacter indicus]